MNTDKTTKEGSAAHALAPAEAAKLLLSHKNILILMHARPDGDTVGSAIALESALRLSGIRAYAVCDDEIPERLRFMLGYRVDFPAELGIEAHNECYRPEALPGDFTPDLTVCTDVASLPLAGAFGKTMSEKVGIDLKIDHHAMGESYARFETVYSDASACGEVIFDITQAMGITDVNVSKAIYAAISSDSGCFRFSSVTPETHERAAALLRNGIQHSEIDKLLHGTTTKKELAATETAIRNMCYYSDGRIALTTITQREMTAAGIDDGDTGIVNSLPITVSGVSLGIAIKQLPDKKEYKISMRSDESIAANEICAKLDGGGHLRAAGGKVTADTLEEAVKKTLDAVHTVYPEL